MLQPDDCETVLGATATDTATDIASTAASSALAAIPGIGPLATAAAPYVRAAVRAIVDWFAGETYDAFTDFTLAVATKDADLPADVMSKATAEERILATLAKGVTPIYCSDSPGARDAIYNAFKARGWEGEPWGQRYNAGFGRMRWWFGVIMHQTAGKGGTACPPEVRDAAIRRVAGDYTAGLTRTLNLCRDGKGQFKRYNRTADPDFDSLILTAVPVLPPADRTMTTAEVTDRVRRDPDAPRDPADVLRRIRDLLAVRG